MKSKRIQWLDFARGISILLVVLGHGVSSVSGFTNEDVWLFHPLNALLFTIAMPCFFAISGYLYKKIDNIHSYLLMIYKKLISLGIPYIIFSIIYVFMQHCGGNNIHDYNSYNSLIYIYKYPISYTWFLYALFFMFIIIGLLDLCHINNAIQCLIYLFMMIINIIYPTLLPSGFSDMCNDIIYFYVGYLLSTRTCKLWLINNLIHFKIKKQVIIFLLIVLFCISFIIQSFYTVPSGTNSSTFSDFITKLISIALLFIISSNIPHKRFFKYFDKYGKVTLIIYLIHWPTISIIRVICQKLIPINNITIILIYIILIVSSWYLSIFIYELSRSVKIINFIFYPRKKYISQLISKTRCGKKFLYHVN